MVTYEDKLNNDFNWALNEASMHFDEGNSVHKTLRGITRRLTELGIPHAVVGGLAMFAHGYRRFTEDVDLVVTRDGMNQIIEKLEGLGYVQPAGTSTTGGTASGSGSVVHGTTPTLPWELITK